MFSATSGILNESNLLNIIFIENIVFKVFKGKFMKIPIVSVWYYRLPFHSNRNTSEVTFSEANSDWKRLGHSPQPMKKLEIGLRSNASPDCNRGGRAGCQLIGFLARLAGQETEIATPINVKPEFQKEQICMSALHMRGCIDPLPFCQQMSPFIY